MTANNVSKSHRALIEKVKQMMDERNMTAYKLSQRSGLSQAGISQFFAAKTAPAFGFLEGLAKGLDVEMKDLFDFEADSSVPPHLLKLMEDQDKAFYDAVEMMAKAANPKRR